MLRVKPDGEGRWLISTESHNKLITAHTTDRALVEKYFEYLPFNKRGLFNIQKKLRSIAVSQSEANKIHLVKAKQ